MDQKQLETAFDKACVRAVQTEPELRPYGKQLVIYAEFHERRPLVLQNLKYQLLCHEKKRPSYHRKGGHQRFIRNGQLIIFEIAKMFMKAIKLHRDQQNMSSAERARLQQGDQLKKDVSSLLQEVPSEQRKEGPG